MKTININCRFCGSPMGTHTLPNVGEGAVITLEDVGIMDARCDACTGVHGVFRDMSIFYNDNVSRDTEEQKEFFQKSEYKLAKYVENLIFDHPASIFNNSYKTPEIETMTQTKVNDIGIGSLTDKEKVIAITQYKDENKQDVSIDTEKITDIKNTIINEREK